MDVHLTWHPLCDGVAKFSSPAIFRIRGPRHCPSRVPGSLTFDFRVYIQLEESPMPTPFMAPRLNSFRSAFRTVSCPFQATPKRYIRLAAETPIEEETLPHYDPEQFYPVHIGDEFNWRYRVTGKLGYGAYSTSWLCRDLLWVLRLRNQPR